MTIRIHTSWRHIRQVLLERIGDGTWPPGCKIPNEVELASEFKCARATVNRALREMAEAGLVVRRRKAGTYISQHPTRKVSMEIPILRREVERANKSYSWTIDQRRIGPAPQKISRIMKTGPNSKILFIRSLHYADENPYVYENRWVNILTVPEIVDEPFNELSPNEWLVKTTPLTTGEIEFTAIPATTKIATFFSVPSSTALLQAERVTWLEGEAVTFVSMTYGATHKISMNI
ncbi:MAG: GntR family transcriptional regulator [bacterium]